MKKILVFLLISFALSCSSDDSETPENNNAPLGKLIQAITTFTNSGETDVVYNSYSYDDSGRVSEVSYGMENTAFINYLYNDEGQIWKENISDGSSREYQYTNGLITSINFSNSEYYYELIYNNNSQLIQSKIYNGDDILQSEKNYTNDNDGNVLSIESGTSIIMYEYDNKNNPFNEAFENQELNKLVHVFALIPPTNTTNNIISKSGSFNSILTHTYNANGLPVNTEEILPNGDIRSVNYTYQE